MVKADDTLLAGLAVLAGEVDVALHSRWVYHVDCMGKTVAWEQWVEPRC